MSVVYPVRRGVHVCGSNNNTNNTNGSGRVLTWGNVPLDKVKEGLTTFFVPTKRGEAVREQLVFYNPAMRNNRDLTLVAIAAFSSTTSKTLTFLDLMSGTGVRSIRLLKEVGDFNLIINDKNVFSYFLIVKNLLHNFPLEKKLVCNGVHLFCFKGLEIRVYNLDANHLMSKLVYEEQIRPEVIDLDPFGSPAPYVENCLKTVNPRGGLIGITATDTPALCGVYPDACKRKYGAKPARTEYCHEVGLRILIGSVASLGAKHGVGVFPLVSFAEKHYMRTIVRTEKNEKKAKLALKRLGYLFYCPRCMWRETSETLCMGSVCLCGKPVEVAGPLWLGGLHNQSFCDQMLRVVDRVETPVTPRLAKLLKLLREEASTKTNCYCYDIHTLSKSFGCSAPGTSWVIAKLREIGYEATRTHLGGTKILTNAPIAALKKILIQ